MKSTWLHRHSRQALIVFCNGWGMDDRPFRHLEADRCDVLMLWDYRQMTPVPDIVALAGQYAEIYLVGWSMGVWAGQRMFSPVREHFQAAIAVNGTLCPIHDRFGIPEATIAGTLRNFSEVSRDKLYLRMCRDRQGRPIFQENLPARSLAGQKEELQALLQECDCRPGKVCTPMSWWPTRMPSCRPPTSCSSGRPPIPVSSAAAIFRFTCGRVGMPFSPRRCGPGLSPRVRVESGQVIFHPDKNEVARRLKRSLATYDDNAVVQERIGARLVDLLGTCPELRFSRVLEVGCRTGLMTEKLCRRFPVETLYLNDLVAEFCDRARQRTEAAVAAAPRLLPGDIEATALPDDLDLIVSSSTLQWLRDYAGVFARFADALRAGGYLVFSFFGDGTLREIRELTGRGLQYPGLEELRGLLEGRFTVLGSESRCDELMFAEPRQVLRHLQATGVGGLGRYRWTPAGLRRFEQDYRRLFGSTRGVRLSYVSHLVAARKIGGERT